MFIDERIVHVRSGNGGDGIVAFRREARIPRGGPAGGDGGDGGHVLFLADEQITTFYDMDGRRHYRATHGQPGGGSKCSGLKGAHRIVRVPVGTSVFDADTGDVLVDMSEPGGQWMAAHGGRGGRGNARFATAIDQAPRHAELGTPGQERTLRLQLRLLADVGLVGLPNAGKSTLLSRITHAQPKIADYPFTTLAPHLGIVELPGGGTCVMADLPGLIEGAHEGHGLGDRFLRHVERTKILVHVVDPFGSPTDEDPVASYKAIRGELEAYGEGLAARPEILVASKLDAAPADESERNAALRRLADLADRPVYPISAVTGQGLPALLRALARVLAKSRAQEQGEATP